MRILIAVMCLALTGCVTMDYLGPVKSPGVIEVSRTHEAGYDMVGRQKVGVQAMEIRRGPYRGAPVWLTWKVGERPEPVIADLGPVYYEREVIQDKPH